MALPKQVVEALVPQFLAQRKILLMDEVGPHTQESIVQAILGLNLVSAEPITLFIDSDAGNTAHGHWISDAIRCSEAPVHGLVVGAALSMAFWIFQNCHRRFAYPRARLMFHGYSLSGVRSDRSDLQAHVDRLRQWHSEDLAIIAKRTGQPLEQWQQWSLEERFFRASEAIQLGLVDEIVPYKPLPGLDE